ncbi:PML-RARA-regulated adapter molecule 1, partial [Galemys pyrenaicus]
GSHQDFRSLQAKFQASLPETSELPKKPPKPEVSKLKKPPQPEFSAVPRKPQQPEFTDLPPKPPKPEFGELSSKVPLFEATSLPRKPPPPEPGALAQQPWKLELSSPSKPPTEPKLSAPPRKPPPPEASGATPKPSQPDFSTSPKKPPHLEFCVPPRKPSLSQIGSLPKKSLPPPEFSEVPKTPPGKSESGEPQPHPLKSVVGTLPKKPLQPEFNSNLRRPLQAQVSGHPKKSLPPPEFSEAPQMPPWKYEPHPEFSQSDLSAFPRKMPQLQLSDAPKLPQSEPGDVTRTCLEPEVSLLPKRLQQPEFKALPKQPPQPKTGGLPRTSEETEFSVLPRKPPQSRSPAEPNAVPRKHSQAAFFGDLPRKPPLPGSASESSLPAATTGPRARLPLSLGLGAAHPRAGVLARRSGSKLGLTPGRLPQRRPLPPLSSLGPPPAKPPLPPGPVDVQSLWSPAASALRRTRSSAGVLIRVQHSEDSPGKRYPSRDPDEIYELYDDVEPTEDPSPSPKGRDEVSSTWRPPKKSQDPLRYHRTAKEKAPEQQQLTPADQKTLKQIRKAEKAEREFRKKFKFEGEIVIQTKMMIDPNAKTRRGGGKHLGIRRGEILEVIEYTNEQEMLCRDTKGKYGYVPRTALLPLETEVYDDVGFWGM